MSLVYRVLFCVWVVSLLAKCDKFAVFMLQMKSHIYPVLPVAEELKKFNHSVIFIQSAHMHDDLEAEGIHVPDIVARSMDRTVVDNIQTVSESKMTGSMLPAYLDLLKAANKQCDRFMKDEELYLTLKAQKFDYAIVDFTPLLCFETLAYKLSLPFIFLGAHIHPPVLNRMPFNPSFMPALWSPFTDKMTLFQRMVNILLYLIHSVKPKLPSLENVVEKYAPERPFISNRDLKKSALLHILDRDVLMDFPLPVPPNIILCGGLATGQSNRLPPNIETFIQKSKRGIVIVAFGSVVKKYTKTVLEKFITAFKKTRDLHFIFRQGNVEKENDNVLFLPWLPQNDILGHTKTRLFITHCGNSGLFEALYHGIPMIGFPMGLDQPANAAIIESKGYGLQMNIFNFTEDELAENINKVAFTDQFRASIQQASKIFHSRPQTPAERAAYWIDLVTKYGTKHFRPASLDMPWYSYYMIDILLITIVFLISFSYGTIIFCKFFYRSCRKENTKNKQD